MDNNIELVLGSQFFEKLQKLRTVKRTKRFVFTPENKKEILTNLRENLEKSMEATGEFKYKITSLGAEYDLMVLKSMTNVTPKTSKFGAIGCLFKLCTSRDGLVNCWMSQPQFETIAPDQEYIVIGRWKEREYNGKKYQDFSVQELVALAEVNLILEKLNSPTQ